MHGHATLAANMIAHVKLPCDATLVEVHAVATTAAVGTIKVGTDADDDGYLQAMNFGASNVPAVADRGDFNGVLNPNLAECPHIAKGTVAEADRSRTIDDQPGSCGCGSSRGKADGGPSGSGWGEVGGGPVRGAGLPAQ